MLIILLLIAAVFRRKKKKQGYQVILDLTLDTQQELFDGLKMSGILGKSNLVMLELVGGGTISECFQTLDGDLVML